jgi:DNA-directed RNA polymerase specialized sigma24 family protein
LDLLELQRDLSRFARSRLARALGGPAARAGLGDLDAAADDVVGEVMVVLWAKRAAWAEVRDMRAWAFGVTRVQVARVVRAARARAAAEMRMPEAAEQMLADPAATWPDRDLGDEQEVVWSARLAGLHRVRSCVLERLGADAWDRILEVAAGPSVARARATRRVLAEQVSAAVNGLRVDVPALAATGAVDVPTWATGQASAGRGLDPTRTVADGVAGTTTAARRALAVWWARRALLLGEPVSARAVERAGLVDDHAPQARAAAARSLVGWLGWTHPDLVAAAAGTEVRT